MALYKSATYHEIKTHEFLINKNAKFVVEHEFIIIPAIALAQTGRILVHKTPYPKLKHKRSFIYILL
jgi:hypothetical protein